MRSLSLVAVTLTALALAGCDDETPTGPDEASLKQTTLASEKAAATVGADSLSLKSHPVFRSAQTGSAKESSVCGVRKRELAAVRSQLVKGVTPPLSAEELSLNAIVADVCN